VQESLARIVRSTWRWTRSMPPTPGLASFARPA